MQRGEGAGHGHVGGAAQGWGECGAVGVDVYAAGEELHEVEWGAEDGGIWAHGEDGGDGDLAAGAWRAWCDACNGVVGYDVDMMGLWVI